MKINRVKFIVPIVVIVWTFSTPTLYTWFLKKHVLKLVQSTIVGSTGETVQRLVENRTNEFGQKVSNCRWSFGELRFSHNAAQTVINGNLNFENDDAISFSLLCWWTGLWPKEVHVLGDSWNSVLIFPRIEPTKLLLELSEDDFNYRKERFGFDFALSNMHPGELFWRTSRMNSTLDQWHLQSDNRIVHHKEPNTNTFISVIGIDPHNRNTAANELFSLPELPDGVVGDLARMFASTDEDEVWRDYCLQFLGSALEREDGVTDEDRALARETLVEALSSTNATFAGTALRALHRGDPADPLVAFNALRIARDPSYPSSSRTAALLILEDCVRATPSTASTLTETASAISSDPSASSLLRRTAEAVQKRSSVQSHDQWNDQGGSQ